MTTSATELEAVDQDVDDGIWHIRRDYHSRGYPWVALCGVVRRVNRGRRFAWELDAMERCQVCMDMHVRRLL